MSNTFNWVDEVARTCQDLGFNEGGSGSGGSGHGAPGDVQRAEGVATQADGSPALDNEYVDTVVDMIPNFSLWQSQIGYSVVKRLGGKAVKLEPTGVVLQPGQEDEEPASEPFKDVWSSTTFQTKKLTGEIAFTREHMRQAKEAGISLATFVLMRLSKLLANNLGELNLNGDESLAGNTRLRKLLTNNDGMLKLTQTSGLHNLYPDTPTDIGKAWDATVYDAMYEEMPKEFKHDGNLVWFQGVAIDTAFARALRNVNPSQASAPFGSQGSPLGDRAWAARHAAMLGGPMGIMPTIVPQMPDDQAGNPGKIAPTSVSGSTNVAVNVQTISTGDLTGRKVRVRMLTTGVETVGTVATTGPNVVTITGKMGQSAISTTAADYEVSLADLTSVILTNPGNYHCLIYDDIRAYHKFDQRRERFLFTIHFEHDLILHEPNAVVLQEGLIKPTATFNT